ncbi:MAG: hypothetical protein MUF71_16140 [Candidatus Kapabacteria bacterium]|jgi:methyltransferase|nr:hypothetical protein [Candidatus Kapabacteria bacterium]
MTIFLFVLFLAIGIQRLLELRIAERNRLLALERGAKEFGAQHYYLFVILHTAWMLGWLVEGWIQTHQAQYWTSEDIGRIILSVTSLMIVIAAQGLRYWAIISLGEAWNTRILVVPGANRIRNGPYQYINHPNYVAVVMELAFVPLIVFAWKTAVIASIVNVLILLIIRIPQENKAMQDFLQDSNHSRK